MSDDLGHAVSVATPSVAVRVAGWKEVPTAGDAVHQVDNEKRAAEVVK